MINTHSILFSKDQSATTTTSTSRYKTVYPTAVNSKYRSNDMKIEFDIALDASPPTQPRTVYYTLIIDEVYPYSQSRKPVLCVNHSFPGPLVEAYEGDTFVIDVWNRLNVPSTLHWHGMRQGGTPDMDGAVGVTQCAIPPGYKTTYKFEANPAGTFWYHGHLLEQYIDGLFGPLIVYPREDPFEGLYTAEQTLMISDWYNKAAHTKLLPWLISGDNINAAEPAPDAIVVNGQFTQSLLISMCGVRRMRFRVINAAASGLYKFSIDGFRLHIIEVDSTPTQPYTVDAFPINVAQRVSCYIDLDELDPIYTANGTSATNAVFIRMTAMNAIIPIDITNFIPPNEKQRYPYPVIYNPSYVAVLSFDCNNSTPSYAIASDTPVLTGTVTPKDTNLLDARPIYQNQSGIPNATCYLKVDVEFLVDTDGNVRPHANNVTYSSDANYMHMRPDPTAGITSDTYAPLLHQMVRKPTELNISSPLLTNESDLPTIQSDGNGHYFVPYGCVVDVYLNNKNVGTHPFHLHSNLFWVIATSEYPEAETLYAGNYLQRDTVNLPPNGWTKIRFVADNPGAWFFHCYIDWHMTEGLAIAFVVAPEQLLENGFTISQSQQNMCEALRQYNIKINATEF